MCIFLLTLGLVGSIKSQTNNSNSIPQQNIGEVYTGSEVDQKAKFKKSPKPSIWNIHKICESRAGLTKVKIILHKSGKITHVELLKSSGCEFFDKNVAEAVGKFKFKPAIKNGQPVSQFITLEYNYSF